MVDQLGSQRGLRALVAVALAVVVVAGASGAAPAATTGPTRVTPQRALVSVVQAVPRDAVSVSVDGRSVRRSVATGTVLGPLLLSPGPHRLDFSGAGAALRTRVVVGAGSSTDVVLHLPASVGGAPVVSTYRTPTAPIGPGKSRVLLAHTATVPPADVRLDGRTVFTNIANGEYAEADVPSGSHRVALTPTGSVAPPFLGPLPLRFAPRTATMVYAVGSPSDGSMDAVVHTVRLRADGSTAPRSIRTGTAGLAAHLAVRPFAVRRAVPRVTRDPHVRRADVA